MKFSGYKQKFIEFWIEEKKKTILTSKRKQSERSSRYFRAGSESIDDGCDVR